MRVLVNGAQLFFDVVGAGLQPAGPIMQPKPTLILLHGGPGFDHTIYRPAFDSLADVAQVVYIDHRGQGRSDIGDPTQWHLAQWADDVVGLCAALEIESPIVFGHSFGGMVAMEYAVRHPNHPSKLILSGTSARLELDSIVRRFLDLGGADAAAAARAFWGAPTVETTVEYRRHCVPHYTVRGSDAHAAMRAIQRVEPAFHFIGGELQTMNRLPELHRIRCPTLVVGATDDPVCPIEGSEAITAALPAHLLHVARMNDCRHVFWADAPDIFFDLVREFVEAPPAALTKRAT
jgi:pimeloyl-ACP methyl ester carboxylesterase